MLHINRKEVAVPSVQQALDVLSFHNSRVGIPLDLDRLLEYYAYYTLRADKLRKEVRTNIGLKSSEPLTPKVFKEWLAASGVKTGLQLTDKGTVSLAEESLQAAVLTGLYSDEVCSIIKIYMEAATSAKKVDSFMNILESGVISAAKTFDKHRMLMVKPVWSAQNTGRLGCSGPALMNIAHDVKDIQTVPEGYVFREIDSGQIEPRIIQSILIRDPQLKKCTMMYNDAYYGYVHYCTYLSNEERASGTLDIRPVELSDEVVAKRKNFKTMGNAVMYGSTENKQHDADKDAFIRYIGNHPNRIALQQEIENKIDRGIRVFYTAFGTPIDITKGPSEAKYTDKKSNAYRAHLIRCAINNPIQGTAADLMRVSVLKAHKLLQEYAPHSMILKYTHDSGTFMVREDEIDKIDEELCGITSYQVDDWIPIYGDCIKEINREGKLRRYV